MQIPTWVISGLDTYGYWAILLLVGLESTGIPLPGETALVLGAVYAATQHSLALPLVIAAAAAGAILGDNLGYTLGRRGGSPLLQRVVPLLHLNPNTLGYAERYFARHGDKTVFLGRFVALVRTWAAFLAGVNHMPRGRFVLWNAAGGVLWATSYGLLGYVLGNNLPLLGRVLRTLGIGGIVVAVVLVLGAITFWWYRRSRRRRREGQMREEIPAAPE